MSDEDKKEAKLRFATVDEEKVELFIVCKDVDEDKAILCEPWIRELHAQSTPPIEVRAVNGAKIATRIKQVKIRMTKGFRTKAPLSWGGQWIGFPPGTRFWLEDLPDFAYVGRAESFNETIQQWRERQQRV